VIEKMSFVSITCPGGDLDKVIDEYISKHDIQPEYAVTEYKTNELLRPVVDQNPYRDEIGYLDDIKKCVDVDLKNVKCDDISKEEALDCIRTNYSFVKESEEKLNVLEKERYNAERQAEALRPFTDLDVDLDRIFAFKHLKYRFGRVPTEYAKRFKEYVHNSIETVFLKAKEEEKYIWGIYFAPAGEIGKVDAAFAALNYEIIKLDCDIHGNIAQGYKAKAETAAKLEEEVKKEKDAIREKLSAEKEKIAKSILKLETYSRNFEARKYAAFLEQDGEKHAIFCGWMTTKDAKKLSQEIKENETDIVCIADDKHTSTDAVPPTKLKNFGIFKPFEMYIKMYGLPAYGELDPTMLVSLTYAFIFGAMFGDVGQGLCLLIGGFLLYKFKKSNLAGIIAEAGFFSTIFGFLFGSIFGFEDIIDAVWLRPVDAMTNVPFIGKLNTVFVLAIGLGMLIILLCMVLNVINCIKAKDYAGLIDTNGICGLVFYGALVLVIMLLMSGKALPATIVLVILFVVPLILIAFKEPIMHLLTKKKAEEKTGAVMFVVQAFFELFEILLSYFSNTLSFIRIGAFAVSHVSIMEVVLMLTGYENGGNGSIVGLIFGNAFVIGFEGLIVGIQVLRLEYYELFSRFYKGTGREFKPYNG